MANKHDAKFYQEILDICLLAGRLMIEGGSEMYRVEDTMLRIAKNAGVDDPRVFATPTCVFMSLDGGNLSQMKQIRDRNINLELVDRVNELSREFANKKIDLIQLHNKIANVETKTPAFPLWMQVIGAAVLSSTLMVLFMDDYDWIDFPIIIKALFPQTIVDNILIGALMTLVPGLAFTNALRDLFMGDLLSGIVRLFEATLTAIALGGGVAIVIKFMGA